MRILSPLIFVLFLLPLFSLAQSDNAKTIGEANDFLARKDVRRALVIFRKLHAQVQPTDKLYPEISKGLFESLWAAAEEKKAAADWEALIDISNEAMQILDTDKNLLPTGYQAKKYWLYENFIVANMGLGKYLAATGPRVRLYDAYEQKQLPAGLDKRFNFELFRYEGFDIKGYEYYVPEKDETGDKVSKQVYYVYSRKDTNGDSGVVSTMETIQLEKKKDTDPNSYVFVKKTVNNKKKTETEVSSINTYTEPVNLDKLHKAAIECLKGEIKFDSEGKGKK